MGALGERVRINGGRMGILATLFIVIALFACASARAQNSVTIQSRDVPPGDTGVTIGVYLTNEVALTGVLLPLELRTVGGAAFWKLRAMVVPGGRLSAWDSASSFGVTGYYATKWSGGFDFGSYCRSDTNGQAWCIPDSAVDFVSPDAVLFVRVGIDSLNPGSDGNPDSGTPSIEIVFDVAEGNGEFVIDSQCISPGNHLVFVDGDGQEVIPSFTAGLVTVCCACDCHADPYCDTVHNVLDVVKISQVVNQSYPEPDDPNPCCPYHTTDVDCDDDTDQTDLDKMAAVVFYAADPDTTFCHPCQ